MVVRGEEEMTGFAVGDKVMHPNFGAGKITGEAHRELVQGFEHYFVIEVIRTRATAYVPIRKMKELGVRSVMSREKMVQVLETLRGEPRVLAEDYRQRQAKIEKKLETRRPIPIAEAIRDLSWHKKEKRLTKRDGDLLAKGVDLLATEMALLAEGEIADAQQTIDAVLEAVMTDAVDEPESLLADVAAPGTQDALLQKLLDRVR
jgi:CarD family transcriptional regulator